MKEETMAPDELSKVKRQCPAFESIISTISPICILSLAMRESRFNTEVISNKRKVAGCSEWMYGIRRKVSNDWGVSGIYRNSRRGYLHSRHRRLAVDRSGSDTLFDILDHLTGAYTSLKHLLPSTTTRVQTA